MTLDLLSIELGIARLDTTASVPPWALGGTFSSVVRTPDEISVVCEAAAIPPECRAEVGWRALRVAGPLDFSLTGVLASIAVPLAAANISLFAISTFDTDYILVRSGDCLRAIETLRRAGHVVGASPTPAPVLAGGAEALATMLADPSPEATDGTQGRSR